eukprot:scaffold198078_cov27-Tisochrysis_lutea.AAC.5
MRAAKYSAPSTSWHAQALDVAGSWVAKREGSAPWMNYKLVVQDGWALWRQSDSERAGGGQGAKQEPCSRYASFCLQHSPSPVPRLSHTCSNVIMKTACEREDESLAAVEAVARCSAPRISSVSTSAGEVRPLGAQKVGDHLVVDLHVPCSHEEPFGGRGIPPRKAFSPALQLAPAPSRSTGRSSKATHSLRSSPPLLLSLPFSFPLSLSLTLSLPLHEPKHLLDSPRHHAPRSPRDHPALHRVGLPCPRVPVRQDASIEAAQKRLDGGESSNREDFLLTVARREDAIERKRISSNRAEAVVHTCGEPLALLTCQRLGSAASALLLAEERTDSHDDTE